MNNTKNHTTHTAPACRVNTSFTVQLSWAINWVWAICFVAPMWHRLTPNYYLQIYNAAPWFLSHTFVFCPNFFWHSFLSALSGAPYITLVGVEYCWVLYFHSAQLRKSQNYQLVNLSKPEKQLNKVTWQSSHSCNAFSIFFHVESLNLASPGWKGQSLWLQLQLQLLAASPVGQSKGEQKGGMLKEASKRKETPPCCPRAACCILREYLVRHFYPGLPFVELAEKLCLCHQEDGCRHPRVM